MIRILQVTILIVLSSIYSGCTPTKPEIVIKKEYIYEKPYAFEKIDIEGAYIEMGSKELQRTCAPKMVELNDVWSGVVAFYTWQIDRYKEDKTEGNPDE